MEVCYELINTNDILISGESKSYISLTAKAIKKFKYVCVPLKSGLIKLPSVIVGKDEGYQYIRNAEKVIKVC